jgi:hypothetical protein
MASYTSTTKAQGASIVATDNGPGEASEFTPPTPDPALKHLDFLVGAWTVEGVTEEGPAGPAGKTAATETYEWLDGGFFLVHHWNGTMDVGGIAMVDTGYEFFDYDPETQEYRARFFNNFGPYDDAGSLYKGTFDGDVLAVTGPARRTFQLNDDGTITADSEMPVGDGTFVPFMKTTMTRVS